MHGQCKSVLRGGCKSVKVRLEGHKIS